MSTAMPSRHGRSRGGRRRGLPGRRAQAISAYFVACYYCGLTIPVVGVGIARALTPDTAVMGP